MRITHYRNKIILTTLAIALSACGGSGSEENAASPTPSPVATTTTAPTPSPSEVAIAMGKSVYENPLPAGNTFTCSTCHALAEPTSDGFTRPGHPIGDALRRSSFKNGQLPTFLDAANTCLDEWMAVPEDQRWTDDTEAFQTLEAYLESEDTEFGQAALVEFNIIEPLDTTNLNGDAGVGEEVFNSTCAVCHGDGATGTQLAPSIVGQQDAELIARRVRTSGRADSTTYEGLTGGRMPFWSEDRLSDSELTDIIAFLQSTVQGEGSGEATGGEVGGGEASCGSTHPKIGQTATLNGFAHNVSGTATVINDCTIEITDFFFDNGGINVQVYGGINGNYNIDLSLSGNLLRPSTPNDSNNPGNEYLGDTLTVNLPDGVSLDDFDGLSIWCVPVRTSFGDGLFQ